MNIKCSNAGEFSGNGLDENQNGHIDISYFAAGITNNYGYRKVINSTIKSFIVTNSVIIRKYSASVCLFRMRTFNDSGTSQPAFLPALVEFYRAVT